MTSPLAGRRVAILRVGNEPPAVAALLEAEGASSAVVSVGTVRDRSDSELRSAVGDLSQFAWVAVTSAHAARRLEIWAKGWPPSVRIGAVGPSSAEAVARARLTCGVVAPDGVAVDLARQLDGGPVLYLAASSARDDLARTLRRRGIDVSTVVAYDLEPRRLDAADVAILAASDVLVAMAPLSIDALCSMAGDDRLALERTPLVAIGPTTVAHASVRGWPVAEESAGRDARSLLDAVRAVTATDTS